MVDGSTHNPMVVGSNPIRGVALLYPWARYFTHSCLTRLRGINEYTFQTCVHDVSTKVLMAAQIHIHNHRMGKLVVMSAENALIAILAVTNKPACSFQLLRPHEAV